MITDDEDLLEGSGYDLDYESSGLFSHEVSGNSEVPESPEEPQQNGRVEFYKKYEVDLLQLDASCMIQFTEAHPVTHATIR
ncbi:Uncharacterized protein FKW44_000802, partial [Caligus rogercresseyi]